MLEIARETDASRLVKVEDALKNTKALRIKQKFYFIGTLS